MFFHVRFEKKNKNFVLYGAEWKGKKLFIKIKVKGEANELTKRKLSKAKKWKGKK